MSKSFLMNGKIAYFILSEQEVLIGSSSGEHFTWLEKHTFENKTDFYYKEELQQLIDKHQLQAVDYEEHVLSWYSETSSLVPMNLLEDSSASEILQFNFSEEKLQFEADYNRIPELSIVNVFEIPLWVKSFFVLRFPRIILQHLGTGLIRGIFNTSSFKSTIHLFLLKTQTLLIHVRHNELLTYNSFEYSSETDLIYYTLNVLKQTQTLDDNGIVLIHPLTSEGISLSVLLENWAKIHDLQNFRVEQPEDLTLKYLATCV